MDNKDLVPLLEEYVNQMKSEIANLNTCGHTLKSEVKVLQNTLGAYNDKTRRCDDIFVDVEQRLRNLEKISPQIKSDKELVETKLNTTKDNVKTLTGQIQWV
jgi:chromosome segregation ATPase